jgi:hypothetical protein
MPRTARLTDALNGRRKAVTLVGAAAALLAGAGTASAATIGGASHAAPVDHAYTVAAHRPARAPQREVVHRSDRAHRPARGLVRRGEARGGSVRRDASAERGMAAPARPYQIYDSVTPSAIPSGHEIATYADGGFAVSPSAVAGKKVLWIDTNGSDPRASALDVEPGDATPAGAGTWAWQKLHADPRGQAIIYTMRSEWPAAQAAVHASLPASLQSHVRWWIADPTGVPHVVPGSSATQWYWGTSYDITTATPGF